MVRRLAFNRRYHSRGGPTGSDCPHGQNEGRRWFGTLAYTLSRGDFSVLDGGASDRDIKIVAPGAGSSGGLLAVA